MNNIDIGEQLERYILDDNNTASWIFLSGECGNIRFQVPQHDHVRGQFYSGNLLVHFFGWWWFVWFIQRVEYDEMK